MIKDRIVTAEQLKEGFVQFVAGCMIRRRYRGVRPFGKGARLFLVDEPPRDEPKHDDLIPIVDARY